MTTVLTGADTLSSVTPDLVINYEHEIDTGVTVHQAISGGPPLIARRDTPRLPRGTFEMYCAAEADALHAAEICNGTQNVDLTSDDVPGAPFTFCPTGQVRVRWNAPYSSWTTLVPYVRLT